MKRKYFVMMIVCFAAIINNIIAQTWSTVGTGINNYGRVGAMCEYNGELYVGGVFDSIGGIPAISIARWNGAMWDSVPGIYSISRYLNLPLSVEIFDMKVYNGELIVAGTTWENGNQFRGIAKWNGTTWSQLGTGMDNRIFSIEVYNGELFATGHFEHAGGIPTRGIARWNGIVWDSVGGPGLNLSPGFSGSALQTYNGELYLAGGFGLINGLPVHSIARWNGVVWDSVGTFGQYGSFESLEVYNNKLYTGGGININNNPAILWISRWDNASWDSVGTGVNSAPNNMTVYNNELYAAGNFDSAGTNQALCIARWDGLQWNTVGSGLDLFHINQDTMIIGFDTIISQREHIYSMYTYNNELYVGGIFSMIGGINANSIAKWHIIGASVNEIQNGEDGITIYPNPVSESVTISINEKQRHAGEIVFYNVMGEKCLTKEMKAQRETVDVSALASGIYFVEVRTQNSAVRKKIVKL
ncbi:MAG TPA: T9SS type A sorting domain-containing protein [Bacteroidia bacterium]|nr:T9SS type A sorting domain-containing protein [Bacteroidia bacterium]